MNKIHFYNFFKYSLIILIFYNIFSLFVLFTNNGSINRILWKFTPYDYSNIMFFPKNYQNLALNENKNINTINQMLEFNNYRNILDPDFWNYKLILDNYSKKNNKSFEVSYINLLVLSKNNGSKKDDLRKYFLKNYKFFSEKSKNKILELLKKTN